MVYDGFSIVLVAFQWCRGLHDGHETAALGGGLGESHHAPREAAGAED